jgi:hypothetical protein
MRNPEAADEIRRLIRHPLDDCESALRAGGTTRALRELDEAVTKLRRLADQLQ